MNDFFYGREIEYKKLNEFVGYILYEVVVGVLLGIIVGVGYCLWVEYFICFVFFCFYIYLVIFLNIVIWILKGWVSNLLLYEKVYEEIVRRIIVF